MRSLRFIAGGVLCGLLLCPLQAEQAVNVPQVLTWDDCVVLAARNNPDLLSALGAMEASRAQYRGSYNGILPHLSISNSYVDSSSTRDNLISNGAGGTVNVESKIWQLYGTASLDLIDLSQWASIQAASAVLKQNQAAVQVSGSTLLLNVYKGFAALLYAQEEVTVNEKIRDTWKTNADMVSLRYKSGSESKGNNMNTQAQLLQAEVGVTQAGRDVQVGQQQLGQAVGLNSYQALAVTGTWTAPAAPNPSPDFTAMIDKIPQIKVQQAVVDQARAAIKSAHSSLWPTLSLNYNKGVSGTYELPQDPYWVFSGLVNYPLFGNGLTSTYYASQAAQRLYDKAQLDLRSLRNQTLTNLESAWSAYAQAEDQVHVQQAFLDAATQRKKEYDILYQSGLVSFQDWILVVNDYVNSQTSVLRAAQNLILAEAQWRFTTGEQITH